MLKLKCHHCGKEIERVKPQINACCFECKLKMVKARTKERYKKLRLEQGKTYVSQS